VGRHRRYTLDRGLRADDEVASCEANGVSSEDEDAGAGADADADADAVARLLGRRPAGSYRVVVRDPEGAPAVIENVPILDEGRPMPTLFWLVDPVAREAVSRFESTGGVRAADGFVDAGELATAHARYAAERDAKIPDHHRGPRPSGGVGGTRRGVKCLHAHLAWWLAGGKDPVGEWVVSQLDIDFGKYTNVNDVRSQLDPDVPGDRDGRP
jgi:hypothetical protein